MLQQMTALLLLTGLCLAQPPASDGDVTVRKTKTHAVKNSQKNATAPVSAEDIKQLKELIQAQQAQIDQLKQLITQRDQQTQQAQQTASDAQKTAVAAREKAAATEIVVANTSAKVENVQADVTDLKTTAANAAVTAQEDQKRIGVVEALSNRFRFSGDVRARYENFFQEGTQDRERFRFRLRFGVDGKLSEDFIGGFALASGSQSDPTTTNQTLSDSTNSPDFMRKPINIDRAYVTWKPSAFRWFSATAGKFAYPWVRTTQVFDSDLNPEGFSETIVHKFANPTLKELNLTATQLVLATVDSGKLNTPNTDSWAYGVQLGGKLQIGQYWSMTPTYSFMNFIRPDIAVFGSNGAGYSSTLVGTNGTAIGSNYGFAPNGMTNCVNTSKAYGNQIGTGFCSQYQYSDLIINNVVKTGIAKLPLNVLFEWEKNLRADSSLTRDGKKHDSLYHIEASLGQLKNKGDIQFGYSYSHTEQDAIIASYAESDQFKPTNVEQNRIFFIWQLRKNTSLGYTEWIGRYLSPSLAGVAKNPYMKRGQLDLVYSF